MWGIDRLTRLVQAMDRKLDSILGQLKKLADLPERVAALAEGETEEMATIDDLRGAEGNVAAALGQLGQTLQQKLDALQAKIDQGVPAVDLQPDVDALNADVQQITQISQQQPNPQPAPTPTP